MFQGSKKFSMKFSFLYYLIICHHVEHFKKFCGKMLKIFKQILLLKLIHIYKSKH
jgi:hypothetical protein